MFCGNCGNKFTEESLFCVKCGSPVDTQNSTARQNVSGQQQPQQHIYQQQQEQYPYQQQQEQYPYQQEYPQYRAANQRHRQTQNATMQSVKAFATSKTGMIVIGTAIVIILVIVLVSNLGGSSLVGTWEATTITFEMMGESHTENLSGGETIIELNDDGTGVIAEPGHRENIEWRTAGGELIITGSAAWPMPSLSYNISGRTLTLEYEEFGGSVVMTLRRIN